MERLKICPQSTLADAVSVGLNLTRFINSSFIARLLGRATSSRRHSHNTRAHSARLFKFHWLLTCKCSSVIWISLSRPRTGLESILCIYISLSYTHSRSQSDVHILTSSYPPQQVARPSERFTHRILIANKSTHANSRDKIFIICVAPKFAFARAALF
jgi:hypothetical protein